MLHYCRVLAQCRVKHRYIILQVPYQAFGFLPAC